MEYITDVAKISGRKLAIRLVKGAYWDYEIKIAQQQGLSDYPVFTCKEYTDINYLACAQKMFASSEYILPQFATHNANSVAGEPYCLRRALNVNDFQNAAQNFVDECFALPACWSATSCYGLSPHWSGHAGTGGVMADAMLAPGDPIFFLHHTNLDTVTEGTRDHAKGAADRIVIERMKDGPCRRGHVALDRILPSLLLLRQLGRWQRRRSVRQRQAADGEEQRRGIG